MNIELIKQYIEYKRQKNSKCIIFKYYEMRVDRNLSSEATFDFLRQASIELKNDNYRVCRTGQKYDYNGKTKVVKDNQLLIAIKS